MLDWGKRFGQGLQLVNILRDLAADLRMGRCYLPEDELRGLGLAARDLVDASKESRLRPVYDRWLGVAEGHLEAGWRYTNALPGHWLRLRLACAWPVLIGVKTLARLRSAPVLDPGRRIKITRAEVRQVMVGSLVRLPFRGLWEEQFRSATGG
jgi:farnesyl-diphosphate farnesyltransferase